MQERLLPSKTPHPNHLTLLIPEKNSWTFSSLTTVPVNQILALCPSPHQARDCEISTVFHGHSRSERWQWSHWSTAILKSSQVNSALLLHGLQKVLSEGLAPYTRSLFLTLVLTLTGKQPRQPIRSPISLHLYGPGQFHGLRDVSLATQSILRTNRD